jgi:hypothetical protein
MSAKLAHQTQKTAGIGNGMRTATIAAVTGTAVTISINGGTFSAGVGVLTSYAPTVGDTVAVFRQDSSWLILGKTTPSPAGNWIKMASLGYQNGWSDVGGAFVMGQYRTVGYEVQVLGVITNAAAQSSGAAIATGLPIPALNVTALAAQGTTARPRVQVDTSGTFKLSDSTIASTSMQFMFNYPLDFLTS